MKGKDWTKAFKHMEELAQKDIWLDGQEDTIRWVSDRLKVQTGVLIADEVGMGKTRVVMSAILAVLKNGGSVAAVVPPGLLSQWKKEWDVFLYPKRKVPLVTEQYAPIILRSYNSMFDDTTLAYPLGQKNSTWLLISHRFNIPRIHAGELRSSPLKRYMLPILAAAIRAKKDGNRRNKFWELLKKEGDWQKECLEESCDKCSERTKKGCQWDTQVKSAAEFLSKKFWVKFRSLTDIRDVEKAKSYYQSEAEEVQRMIGALLGPIDLLVIDEAHKSRDTEEDQTQLGNLLRNIIKLKEGAKRVALTATPMELRANQWETIFERIGEKEIFPREGIKDFAVAHVEANKHPDNPEIIRNLIEKSKTFSNSLKPFVTRRRRTKQKAFIDLVGGAACDSDAHPHRDYSKLIKIEFNDVETWRPAIFGLEALGKVAKGLSIENGDQELNSLLRKLKIMDSRYAAGQIDKTVDDSDKEEIDASALEKKRDEFSLLTEKIDSWLKDNKSGDPLVQGKLKRIRYWLNKIRGNDSGDLSGHPRVENMADAIEQLVWGENGELKEKVLVFGTFVGPLRILRDVLNRRAVLRILDRKSEDGKEPPLPGAETCRLTDISNIWEEYKRIKGSLTGREQFSQGLQKQGTLVKIIEKAGKAYKNLQAKIEDHINVDKFVKTLPGDLAIKEGKLEKDVVAFLRSRLINDMICGKTETLTDPIDIKMRALEIWVEFLVSFLDTEAGDGKPMKTEWKIPDYFYEGNIKSEELQKLDHVADNMGAKLVGPLKAEIDETSSRFGSFARMLYGGVKMETRRILQTQFNNKKSFPMVLIAQSQVGREGLNLHEACRTVLQFHSEWNPGVIEQQIGRVDRINSFWEEKAKAWKIDSIKIPNKEAGTTEAEDSEKYKGPKIIVMPIIFEGTYDAFQYGVSKRRRETLKAHLFGELLNDEALEKLKKMPEEGEWGELRELLKKAAPDFSPPIRKLPYK